MTLQLQKVAFVSQKFESTNANQFDDSGPPDEEVPGGRPKADKVQDEIRKTIGAGVQYVVYRLCKGKNTLKNICTSQY